MQLATLRDSLDGPTEILTQGTTIFDELAVLEVLNDELGTSFDPQGASLDLGMFYDVDPFDVRDVLPHFDLDNSLVHGSYPDPTFGRVPLPEPDSTLQLAAGIAAVLALARRRRGRDA